MKDDLMKAVFGMGDFLEFQEQLNMETALLRELFQNQSFDKKGGKSGIELECWLIDQDGLPVPKNKVFLDTVNEPKIQCELSQYNFEMNSDPFVLGPKFLKKLDKDMTSLWSASCKTADEMGLNALMIGIPPTIRTEMLNLDTISERQRYQVLNDQILKIRRGEPLKIDIQGEEHLQIEHRDIMLESATTSLQIHLQLPFEKSVRYFNASYIAAAFMVAISANAPFFQGKQLWDDTRIPLFEQAVSILEFMKRDGAQRRVFFGVDYVKDSLLELYMENVAKYPVLIPQMYDSQGAVFRHLRLHNGTIWRWNRPKIGWSKGEGRSPHLRLEHRVASAGPTLVDSLANVVFFLGLVQRLSTLKKSPHLQLPFEYVNTNFYSAAKDSFRSRVHWVDGKKHRMKTLLLDTCIPLVKEGLSDLGFDASEIGFYVDEILVERIRSGLNGAEWQKRVYQQTSDFQALVLAYESNQRTNTPVHRWEVGV